MPENPPLSPGVRPSSRYRHVGSGCPNRSSGAGSVADFASPGTFSILPERRSCAEIPFSRSRFSTVVPKRRDSAYIVSRERRCGTYNPPRQPGSDDPCTAPMPPFSASSVLLDRLFANQNDRTRFQVNRIQAGIVLHDGFDRDRIAPRNPIKGFALLHRVLIEGLLQLFRRKLLLYDDTCFTTGILRLWSALSP